MAFRAQDTHLYSEAMHPGRCRVCHGATSRCRQQHWGPQVSPCPRSECKPVKGGSEVGQTTGGPQPASWEMWRRLVACGPKWKCGRTGVSIQVSCPAPSLQKTQPLFLPEAGAKAGCRGPHPSPGASASVSVSRTAG